MLFRRLIQGSPITLTAKQYVRRPLFCVNCINFNTKSSIIIARTCSTSPEKNELMNISFENVQNKSKETYLDLIRIYINRNFVHRRGHVEFIYSALKNMDAFGVKKDLEVYKALIDVLPKGKFIPRNIFQAEFMHYPKQQQCIVDLLEQMEDNAVMPDYEMEDLLKNIFGGRGHPVRKYWRMMYWMPKFKNSSPFPLPNPVPDDSFELAQLAIHRISGIDVQSQVKVYQTREIDDAIEDTWVVSAQAPAQKTLLKEHDVQKPIYVEGSYKIWLKNRSVDYFVLRRKPEVREKQYEDLDDVGSFKVPLFGAKLPVKNYLKKMPTVHEQDDGVILAVCATGTSSKDSLLSWIRHLEKDGNDVLANAPIVFTLRSGPKEVTTVTNEQKQLSSE